MEQNRFDACMQRICDGDKDALKEIYEEYMTYVFSVIYQIVGNHADAEDITADFFVKLWTGSDKYEKGFAHKAYLATVARHMAIDFLRKHKKEVLVSEFTTDISADEGEARTDTMIVSDSQANGETINGGSPVSLVEQEVIENISLKEALGRLKPREREVINMKIMGDMTFKEISEATKSPMGTVTWLYRQAINKLRRCGYE